MFPRFFCFEVVNYAYATQQGILTKIRACEHLPKFCEHEQASTHLISASNSSKGQILRALSNLMGPFDTPTFAEQDSGEKLLRTAHAKYGWDSREDERLQAGGEAAWVCRDDFQPGIT